MVQKLQLNLGKW